MSIIKKDIKDYWTQRAGSYAEYNRQELSDNRREQWKECLISNIEAHIPNKKRSEIQVLDIGCGPGFFAIILAEAGYQVTAMDSTEEMLKEAGDNAGDLGDYIAWHVGDAQNLMLPSDTYDVIVSRNVTWNLPNPEAAYKEWLRVLKNDGIMLNFDANWYNYLFDSKKKDAFNTDRANAAALSLDDCNVGGENDHFDRCEELAKKMPLSKIQRPAWDMDILKKLGFQSIFCDEEIWKSVWSEDEKVSCASTPMFLLRAAKESCKDRIVNYWEKRSDTFLSQRRSELHHPIYDRWITEIKKYIPFDTTLNILDVGCGPGFFSVLLGKQGHQVTGVDLTPSMVADAAILASEENIDCSFQVMDAENLAFADESFDCIISRNLTWTLPHPEAAYKEWLRVLKPGGILLNFDANYGKEDSTDTRGLPEKHAHHTIGMDMNIENEAIKKQLPITFRERPAWDFQILSELGVEHFTIDTGVNKRIYTEVDEFYNPTPIFTLCIKK